MKVWPLILLVIIPIFADYDAKRIHANIFDITWRHMKLGRIMNAVYLQTQLANNKIDYYDVIAGIWNLKDKTVIDKLVSFKIDGLSGLLTDLETAINGVPDGIMLNVDVKEIRKNLKLVREITPEMRQILNKATDEKQLPQVIHAPFFLEMDKNYGEKVLKLHEVAASRNFYHYFDFTNLKYAIEGCKYWIQKFNEFSENVKKDFEKPLTSIKEGHKTGITVYEKFNNVQILSDIIDTAKINLTHFETIQASYPEIDLLPALTSLNSVLTNVRLLSKNMPIAPSFATNRMLSMIGRDVNDHWVLDVLKDGNNSEKLENYLENFQKITDEFKLVDRIGINLFDPDALLNMESLIDILEIFQNFPYPSVLDVLKSCIQIEKPPYRPEDIKDIQPELAKLVEALPDIQEKVEKIPDKEGFLEKTSTFIESLKKVDASNFEEFKKSETFKNIESVFKDLKSYFSSFVQSSEFVENVKKLDEEVKKVNKVLEWISRMDIRMKKCDIVYTMNDFTKINEAPGIVKVGKARNPFVNLKPLFDKLPKISAFLTELKTKATSPKRNFVVKNPRNLLDVAFAIKSLERMEEVSDLFDEFEMFSQEGQKMSEIIKTWPDSSTKQDMEKIWSEFPGINEKMKSLRTNIKKAFATMTSSFPEKSLKEVGNVYSKLSKIQMSEKIELREMRESMAVFEVFNPNFRMENSKFIEALEKLEKPISMDWGMAFSSFKKVPNALNELEIDFERFFTGNDGDDGDGGDNGSFWKWCKDNLIITFILFVILPLIIILSILGFLDWWKNYRDPEMKNEAPMAEYYLPTKYASDNNYTYMQCQDSRFDLNKIVRRTGNTQLFDAVVARDWHLVASLSAKGAIMDAVCQTSRTALFELLILKRRHMCEQLLMHGADPEIHEQAGMDCYILAKIVGLWDLFGEYMRKKKDGEVITRILPCERRPWNILVWDPKCFPRKLRKHLPLRFKKNVTWGYKDGMDLDNFTQIIVPQKYIMDEDTLILTDDDLLVWMIYGCKATLVTSEWLLSMANEKDPKEKYLLMEEDYHHWIFHTFYRNRIHENTVFKLKTGIHQMQPKLLAGVKIFMLDTKEETVMDKQDEWKYLIEYFGGTNVTEIMPDTKSRILPYHVMKPDYPLKNRQSSMWVLKYYDSLINPLWLADRNRLCLVDFRFLPECLARFQILPTNNDVILLAGYDLNSPIDVTDSGSTAKEATDSERAKISKMMSKAGNKK